VGAAWSSHDHEQPSEGKRTSLGSTESPATAASNTVMDGWRSLVSEEDYDAALKKFDEVIALEPELVKAYFGRATVWSRRGCKDKALADLNKVLTLAPSHGGAYCERGRLRLDMQDYSKAVHDFTKAIEVGHERIRPHAHQGRAHAWSGLGEPSKALVDIDEAIRLDPSRAYLHAERSRFLLGDGTATKGAVAAAKRAVELEPNAHNYDNLGFVLESDGQYKQAAAALRQAIAADPQDAIPLTRLAWLLATCKDDQVQDAKAAEELATKACRLTASEEGYTKGRPIEALAASYAAQGRFPEAIRRQEEALGMYDEPIVRGAAEARLELYRQGKPCRRASIPEPKKTLVITAQY